MANIRCLAELNDESDDAHKTSSFTGGKKSGLAVQNPSDGDARETSYHVVVYNNGFIANDSPFVALSAAEVEEFLKELERGQAPEVLKADPSLKNATLLRLSVERRSEDYKAPQAPVTTPLFEGCGYRLAENRTSPMASLPPHVGPAKVEDQSCSITFRFATGQRRCEQFSLTATVSDLHTYIRSVIGQSTPYQLKHGFPPEDFAASPKSTLLETGVLNTVMTVTD